MRTKNHMKRHAVVQPLDDSYRLIPLTQGQNAIVDVADFDWLNEWNWRALWNAQMRCFYVGHRDWKKPPIIYMAREITKCGPNLFVDHKNHDTLDNRRENLRVCTPLQNSRNRKIYSNNRSGYKGVTQCQGERVWLAEISGNKNRIIIGRFKTPEEAARAYDEAAKKYHGEFAHLNFTEASAELPVHK